MNSSTNKRKERDLMKLMMSNYDVHLTDENNTNDLHVIFKGPKDSPYEGGTWKVHVMIPDQYPYKSPSIGFHNKIYHPNVDEVSGTVCLDVINQTWSPMYDLINIFETFLPQLLLYPNPTDPLNGEAARLLLKDNEKYNEKVKEFIKFYASANLSFKDKRDTKKTNITNNTDISNDKEQDKNCKIQESDSEASELSYASIEVEDC